MTDRHKYPPYSLRLPEDLRDFLEEEAKKNGRSLHSEIIFRLEATARATRSTRLKLSGNSLDTAAETFLLMGELVKRMDDLVKAGVEIIDTAKKNKK